MTGIYPAVVELSGGNLVLVIVVGLIALGALGMAAMFRRGPGRRRGHRQHEEHRPGRAGGRGRLPAATVPHPRDLRGAGVLRAPGAAGRRHDRADLPLRLLPGGRRLLRHRRLPRHVARRARQPARGRGRQHRGPRPGHDIGLRTGAMVGMLTVGLGLLGASIVVLAFQDEAPDVLEGFGFGAALLAMFMRVGGGIFTKAADVGADLVGKVEQNIPEDDPRNAATIADNVGDNVGDCAGMAADLFESYAVTLVAALILGSQAFGDKGLVYPLLIPAIGALTAVAGVYLTKPRAGENGLTTINRAFYLSAGIAALASVVLSFVYLPSSFADFDERSSGSTIGRRRRRPAVHRLARGGHRHRDGRRHPGAHRLLHRHRVPPGQGRRQDLAHRRRDGHPLRPRGRLRVGGLHHPGDRGGRLRRLPAGRRDADRLAVRGRARGLRPADHRRRDRGHGHLRSGLRQRPGHRRDVRRREPRGRADPDRARRGRQHHQGDHQGHRDRDRGARRDARCSAPTPPRSLEALAEADADARTRPTSLGLPGLQPGRPGRRRSSALRWCSCSPAWRSTPWPGLPAPSSSRCAASSARSPGSWRAPAVRSTARSSTSSPRTRCASWSRPASSRCWRRWRSASASASRPLAGFLAGAIGTGTLMAVFLANSGGAWDNAKKLVEDGNHGGKGSLGPRGDDHRRHRRRPVQGHRRPGDQPADQGDEPGLAADRQRRRLHERRRDQNDALRIVIAIVAALIIAGAVYISKQREVIGGDELRPRRRPGPPRLAAPADRPGRSPPDLEHHAVDAARRSRATGHAVHVGTAQRWRRREHLALARPFGCMTVPDRPSLR